ncbi:P-loop containing nucleoside triphosphate hydrolase protein [Mycena galericulata]|nr:P-loop containing nucleoside triphosphate hydrolase protein [Mycena galericulata]
MKILVLGFCRTGTASMRAALATLGYGNAHHIGRVMANPNDVDAWRAAIDAKFHGQGKILCEREEWDQLLGEYQEIADVPAILFAEELINAYPEAQIILTTRDSERWWKSFRETLLVMLGTRQTRLARWLDPNGYGKFVPFARLNLEILLGPLNTLSEVEAKRRYLQYYDRIRALAPKERLLEYEMGQGWGPLCAFLRKDVPDVPFPHRNDTTMILEGSRRQMRGIYWRTAVRLSLPAAALMAVLVFIFPGRS